MSNDLEKNSISNTLTPAQKVGGGLMSALSRTAYTLATPAALLLTAKIVMGKKSRKNRKAKNHRRKTGKKRSA